MMIPSAFMILHIPHSSKRIPPGIQESILLSNEELESELLRMTDAFVDELFTCGETEAIRAVFPYSRLVVDVERFLDDAKEPMAAKGMGAVYLKTSTGKQLRKQLSGAEHHFLIEEYYIPHHNELVSLVEKALKDHGYCIILDCHSFSSIPLPHEPDQTLNRPDICIGTDSFHTPDWLSGSVMDIFLKQGFRAELNRPFSGTIVPGAYYRKTPAVMSLMIEINRSHYMDEQTGQKLTSFNDIRFCMREILLNRLMELMDDGR